MKKLFALLCVVMLCLTFCVSCANASSYVDPVPTGITLSGMRVSFGYEEKFSAAGLKVGIEFSDGTSRTAGTNEYEVDYTDYNSKIIGEYEIKVKLKDTQISKHYNVTVSEEESENNLDVWIMMGQSNAAGYTDYNAALSGGTGTYRNWLEEQDVRNIEGYNNVHYYGAVDVQTVPALNDRPVKIGYGTNSNCFGLELGAANVLSERPRQSAIIKFAVGGTRLCDIEGIDGATNEWGTWASPSVTSYARSHGVETVHAKNGALFNRLINIATNGIDYYEKQGYNVTVRGFFWMQGESDSWDFNCANRYAAYLPLFIDDVRGMLFNLTGHFEVETCPFIVGKISPNGAYGNYVDLVRYAEDKTAEEVPNVYTIDTADFTVFQEDNVHFNPEDMYELGARFARAALDTIGH